MNKELFQYYIGKYCVFLIIPFTFMITVLSYVMLHIQYNAYFHPLKMKCVTKNSASENNDIDTSDIILSAACGILVMCMCAVLIIFAIAFPLVFLMLGIIAGLILACKEIYNCRKFYINNKDRIERLNEIHKL